ncbi:aldehyde dehydrogenase [Agaricicola taiwanensis]|uniref:aldehyde dehydrogenase (NAD(+)) n=1 Tax=Agaricicola taiwanensis TaxID=591372 RepID=A0A8J2VMP1_9RHOB|nr:aldehyde dehydrogenase family protein [Agaricicola taiwanensis]GGE30957.1 aldehyde dehydrogenase [Agaricicola taiwanensis]
MANDLNLYIDGSWRPAGGPKLDVNDPATEEVTAQVGTASERDVEDAVAAARAAFDGWAMVPVAERADLVEAVVQQIEARTDELVDRISREMGSPLDWARTAHVANCIERFVMAAKLARDYEFEHMVGTSRVVREPVGVCAFITPWNWPLNQAASKIAFGLVTGNTIVWKPSEIAPLSAVTLTEAIAAVGLPRGVFNLVQGDGPNVGARLSAHPDVDMVSFTGSTRGGIAVAKAAADTVKRVHQELGGKSANIILPSADFESAVVAGVKACFRNTGQSCLAATRMLVERSRMDEAAEIARVTAETVKTGDPRRQGTDLGPLVSKAQWDKVQRLIECGISEGAVLATGGPGKPEGLEKGYFVRPTVFRDVTNDMTIAQEEIFGPVLSIMAYEDVDDAIRIANESQYGLAAYVCGHDRGELERVGRKIRAGRIYINYAPARCDVPFGGYKQSGNGREQGKEGLEDFTEVKAFLGYEAA